MAGAIIIVVVLLLIPVLVLMSGGIAVGRPRRDAGARRRGAQRGQRAPRPRPTERRDAPPRRLDRGADRGDRRATPIERVGLDPPPLDGPRTPAELRAAAGPTITADGHRRARGAARLRRRAGPGVHLRRPPALPVVRAGRADRGGDPVRPRRRGVEHLRRLVAGGRRRGVRRERGAALDRRPRRAAGRRPAACSSAAARPATSAR